MSDPTADLAGKVAVNIISEVFKSTLHGLGEAKTWLKDKGKEYDPFGRAAQKYSDKLEGRYNSVHIFGMNRPLALRTIFTEVNVLEGITARHHVTVEELERFFDRDSRNFGGTGKTREGIGVVNEIQKIIVLGKPGAGKTTFLKSLVLQALDGNLNDKLIPIFVGLKEWSDSQSSLFDFIVEQFDICDFPDAELFVARILSKGKCLVLLDGFDEVSGDDLDEVITEIRNFHTKYNKNKFVLSCRIAAYNYHFESFTEVEIADFGWRQINTFINNWFGKGSIKANACLNAINQNKPIKELANIPLLLTIFCLAFNETMEFPANRAELYKEALDALLKKWDTSRSIKRDNVYRQLSLQRKESLFSRIAATTFEKNQYFMPRRFLEKQIASYIQNLPEASTDSLEFDSEALLKAIEAQHGILIERARGIYSFSHLTFQEYFTAKYIIDNESKGALEALVKMHFATGTDDDVRWREVFLLVANMLDDADRFLYLMLERINGFGKDKLNAFLSEIAKAIKPFTSFSETAARALAINLFLESCLHVGDRVATIQSGNSALKIAQADSQVGKLLKEKGGIAVAYHAAVNISSAKSIRFTGNELIFNLRHYLQAIKLLLECLSTECYVSNRTRQDIYESLLLQA